MLQNKSLKMRSDIDFSNKAICKKYETYATMLKDQILNCISRNDAIFLAKYYAQLSLFNLGVRDNIEINILGKNVINKMYNNTNKRKSIKAVAEPSKNQIILSNQIIKSIQSGNPEEIFKAFRVIFHETKHIAQSKVNIQSIKSYIMAIELIAMRADPYFYSNNYAEFYRENDAENYGRDTASYYFPEIERLVDKRYFKFETEMFEKKFTENVKTIIGKIYDDDGTIIKKGSEYPNGERIKIMELMANKYISKYPKRAFKMCPVLQLVFNSNGSRKTDIELLSDAIYLSENSNNPSEKLDIEDFYEIIIKNRYSDDYEKDCIDIENYAKKLEWRPAIIDKVKADKEISAMSGITKKSVESMLEYYGIGVNLADKIRRATYMRSAKRAQNRKMKQNSVQVQYYLDSTKSNENEISKETSTTSSKREIDNYKLTPEESKYNPTITKKVSTEEQDFSR